MKKLVRYILLFTGLFLVLIFHVGAAAGITGNEIIDANSFSKSIYTLLMGIGLIGLGSFTNRKFIR